MRFGAAVLLAVIAAPASGQRAVPDTVFIVPGSHLDVGFTAPISEVRARRIAILDAAIADAERDHHFVWFEEGGWAVEAWLDHYHDQPSRIARLRALVERGQIGVGATMLSPYAAGFPEALHLLTQHLDRIQRELGRRPTVAVINDVPAVPETVVDVLAAAGIHDLLMGPNLVFSSSLPGAVTQSPFYWQSSHGARVLVAIDTNGYSTAITRWWLPPACIRALDPSHFPASVSDDAILATGVTHQLDIRAAAQPLAIIQQAMDNGPPDCAAALPAALSEWNANSQRARLVAATPDVFFEHLARRFSWQLPVRRGEWGADWDLLRMSEPVWSWRLRGALAAITPTAPHDLQIAGITVADHNVGLGPRWMDGLPATVARQHIAEVFALYRDVVRRGTGAAALSAVPPAIALPRTGAWPAPWTAIVGDRARAARVRAGPAFLFPFVSDSAPVMTAPITLAADASRLVVHTSVDRVGFEGRLGPRYQAVLEIPLHVPISALRIAPANSPDAIAGRWLMGAPPSHIVSPAGVRVTGPGWALVAHGPLLIGWALVPDRRDPSITQLQALLVINAVEGTVAGGAQLRLPFSEMYPGEPPVPAFDLELDLLPRR